MMHVNLTAEYRYFSFVFSFGYGKACFGLAENA